MRKQMNYGYYSDSFDRFDDDLCEFILSYLPIRYKLQFECVSKQWKSFIFNKQQIISINRQFKIPETLKYYEYFLEVFIKKFMFIKEIEIFNHINDHIIEALIRNCQYLEKVTLKGAINEIRFIELIEKCGGRFKFIDTRGLVGQEIGYISILSSNLNFKYYKQIRKLGISLSSDIDSNEKLAKISHLENLKSLDLILNGYFDIIIIIDKGLLCIGQKCTKLKKFSIHSKDVFKEKKIFELLSQFHGIQKLSIGLNEIEEKELNFGDLKHLTNCKNLKHLEFRVLGLKDKHLENIHLILPNLKSFISHSLTRGITHKTENNLAKLKTISSVKIINGFQNSSAFTNLIESRSKLKMISVYHLCVTHELIEALIENALKNPKFQYNLNILNLFVAKLGPKQLITRKLPQNMFINKMNFNLHLNI
jgi:hypothetical protein